jgi:hypothetical protein
MKVLKFIKWSWDKTDAWTRWWFVACGLFGASLGDGNKVTAMYYFYGAMSIFAGMMAIGLYNVAKASYVKFEKEYDGLFEVIKESDKK